MTEKEYIKEYEEMSLYDFADELVEPLFIVKQDLTKTIYIHYAKKRDENIQLQNRWNKLKEWLQARNKCFCEEELLNKIQELEEKK